MGDIVLLKNDSSTRVFWKLARVEELISGADGKIRAAIVKGGNSERRSAYLRRVVQHLIPIEVRSNVDNEVRQPAENQVSNLAVRPRRTAAVVGEVNCRELNLV